MIEDRSEELARLHRETFGEELRLQPSYPNGNGHPPQMADDEIIRHAEQADNGDKFRALFYLGDTGPYGVDDSAADLALLSVLAF